MVKTEAFPTIRMKIDRLLKITNEYQFNDLVKAVYCINLCINNRSVLESCLALNACLIEYEEKGSKRIGTYDEFKGFFGKIYDVMKPGIADDYTVEDFGEVQLRYNDKFYRVIIGTGHNNVYACLNFLPTLARNISREEELCLALEYVSGTIDYFIEENKNDGVVEKRFVLPTEILFYKVQKFFKEEVKKYDILELDSLMMSEGCLLYTSIISTSLRGGSNSDILANECAKRAKEVGHDVELLSLKGKDIKYCIGCLSCQRTGMCVQKDDIADIMAKVKNAEVIVYATPIYYYEM